MKQFSETVIVTVSVLGDAGTGTGSQHIELELPDDYSLDVARTVGSAMGDAFRKAFIEANNDFAPEIVRIWRAKARGDQGLSDSGPASA